MLRLLPRRRPRRQGAVADRRQVQARRLQRRHRREHRLRYPRHPDGHLRRPAAFTPFRRRARPRESRSGHPPASHSSNASPPPGRTGRFAASPPRPAAPASSCRTVGAPVRMTTGWTEHALRKRRSGPGLPVGIPQSLKIRCRGVDFQGLRARRQPARACAAPGAAIALPP